MSIPTTPSIPHVSIKTVLTQGTVVQEKKGLYKKIYNKLKGKFSKNK